MYITIKESVVIGKKTLHRVFSCDSRAFLFRYSNYYTTLTITQIVTVMAKEIGHMADKFHCSNHET